MRIVSGFLKGRRFSPPSSFKARPTTDQARESLFNILNNLIDFEEQVVLDLFSGTGAMSYEFASRGCKSVTAIEKNYAHYKFIKSTTQELGLNKTIKIKKVDAFKLLSKIPESYTLIFADPPFNLPQIAHIPEMVMHSDHLTNEGLFILEHGPDQNFESDQYFWQVRHYGKVNFSFFKHP